MGLVIGVCLCSISGDKEKLTLVTMLQWFSIYWGFRWHTNERCKSYSDFRPGLMHSSAHYFTCQRPGIVKKEVSVTLDEDRNQEERTVRGYLLGNCTELLWLFPVDLMAAVCLRSVNKTND